MKIPKNSGFFPGFPATRYEMGCPALGIWVGFLKQPALPGEAPQKKILQKKSKK
jgi:hypothetical protein